jgi:hypothetical protein
LRERERVVNKDKEDREHLVGEAPLRRKKSQVWCQSIHFIRGVSLRCFWASMLLEKIN